MSLTMFIFSCEELVRPVGLFLAVKTVRGVRLRASSRDNSPVIMVKEEKCNDILPLPTKVD